MTLITCVIGIIATTILPIPAIIIRMHKWESPLAMTKSETESDAELQSTNLGNYMASVGTALFKADQCGRCGAQTVQLDGNDKDRILHQMFGEVFPLTIDLKKDSPACDAQVTCSSSRPAKESSIPHWHLTKKLFNKHLTPKVKDQEKLATMREKLKTTLVVHLRGNNIMSRDNKYEAHSRLDYLPAPCAYITASIKSGNFSKVQMVGQVDHPCISYIQATFPEAAYEPKSIYEDFMTLMSARNIALSTSSTFGYAAMMMNPNEDLRVFMPTYKGKQMCCEGNFDNQRLSELCHIGQQAVVYEIPALVQSPIPTNRIAWVLDDSKFQDSIVHTCM